MKFVNQIINLANKFESKLLKEAQDDALVISQLGTTELFFDNEDNQKSFNKAIQSGNLAKYLTEVATKTQKTAGFDLKIQANPKKGAAWMLTVNPPSLAGPVSKLLDNEFHKIVGKGMVDAQKSADFAAKSGNGSGILDVGSFTADMD